VTRATTGRATAATTPETADARKTILMSRAGRTARDRRPRRKMLWGTGPLRYDCARRPVLRTPPAGRH